MAARIPYLMFTDMVTLLSQFLSILFTLIEHIFRKKILKQVRHFQDGNYIELATSLPTSHTVTVTDTPECIFLK